MDVTSSVGGITRLGPRARLRAGASRKRDAARATDGARQAARGAALDADEQSRHAGSARIRDRSRDVSAAAAGAVERARSKNRDAARCLHGPAADVAAA